MTILDEQSGNKDEPLKKDIEINAATSSAAPETAPPPYTSIPTTSSNPIPSSQVTRAIPHTDPHPHPHPHPHVILHRRPSPIRRFCGAFLVAWLVVLLCNIFMQSFHKARHSVPGRRHGYEHEVVRLHSFHFFMLLELIDS